jgi:peptidoglycan/LPS O-acetylase OafA/YrhL
MFRTFIMNNINDSKPHTQNSYLFLRFILATLVLVSHVLASVGGFNEIILGKFSIGTISVFCFFTLSGYLVLPGLINKGVKRFIVHRIARIYPGYFILLIFTIIVIFPIWRIQNNSTLFDWFTAVNYLKKNLILFPQSAGDPSSTWNLLSGYPFHGPHQSVVNAPIWTLPIELLCYFGLAFMLIFVNKFKFLNFKFFLAAVLLITWILAVIGGFIYQSFGVQNQTGIEQISTKIPYLLSFLVGAALRFVNIELITGLKLVLLIPIAVFSLHNLFLWALIGTFLLGIFVIVLGNSQIFYKFSNFRDISYGTYLYHYPIIQVLVGFPFLAQNFLLTLIPTLLITYTFAYLSSKFIEIPIQTFVKARLA